MEIPNEALEEITEGRTRIMVPKKALTDDAPPRRPAFFNPRARLNRDLSIIAYAAFLRDFQGPKIFLDGLSGVGARGLRVANELKVDSVVLNDLNPSALSMAEHSARLNNVRNVEFVKNDVCRFFSGHSKSGRRGSIVDIDPFGSPAAFFDCGIRATMHGGILSAAATDLQVLNGIFPSACRRKYGGVPVRTEYGNEMAIRLVLGCIRAVAGRLGVEAIPVFAESDMHYYRTYVRILSRPGQGGDLGYILHCKGCGHRKTSPELDFKCEFCGSGLDAAGPLWTGKIFEKKFVKSMAEETGSLTVDKNCEKILEKCLLESDLPATYFTLDEIASKAKSSPPRLEQAVKELEKGGFAASPTSFSPTGFRTDARIGEIIETFRAIR